MASQSFLTLKETAKLLRVSEKTVTRYIKAKKLRASKMGQWRIKRADVERFFKKHSNGRPRKGAAAKK